MALNVFHLFSITTHTHTHPFHSTLGKIPHMCRFISGYLEYIQFMLYIHTCVCVCVYIPVKEVNCLTNNYIIPFNGIELHEKLTKSHTKTILQIQLKNEECVDWIPNFSIDTFQVFFIVSLINISIYFLLSTLLPPLILYEFIGVFCFCQL